jgi:hypothetical protein
VSGDRPPPRDYGADPRRELEPGGFRVRSEPDQASRVAIEVAYTEGAKPDKLRKQLADAIATAFGEIDKRFR